MKRMYAIQVETEDGEIFLSQPPTPEMDGGVIVLTPIQIAALRKMLTDAEKEASQ